jgi:hypothetical protein
VIGKNLFLLETSVRRDSNALTNLNLLAYGPTDKLELTAGFTTVPARRGGFLEIFRSSHEQAKYLFTEGTGTVTLVWPLGWRWHALRFSRFANPSWSGLPTRRNRSLGRKSGV